jgi:tetratricopeptide (TPR) repeat protein
MEQKNYAEALRHFTSCEVMAKATNPKLLDRDFYFQVGACSERTGDYKRAEENFETCLKMAPDWPEALNYLGYMWAERGEKLDRAREMIEKAVKAEPKNGAFLDSLAWVLFKQNQPQEALPYALQAVENTPKADPTVFDHLGDIYAALNQPEKARASWQKALELEPNEAIKKKLDGQKP